MLCRQFVPATSVFFSESSESKRNKSSPTASSDRLPFAMKIIKTLQTGQEAGGDIRGKRSAGLLLAEGEQTGKYWQGIIYNLRIDDHPNPLQEMERLYNIATAYQYMNKGDNAYYEENNSRAAVEFYEKAYELYPQNPEMKFWYAKLLWDMGEKEKAKASIQELKKVGSNWEEYWSRVLNTS